MTRTNRRRTRLALLAIAGLSATAIAGCGDDGGGDTTAAPAAAATPLDIAIAGNGKKAKISVPASVKGGLAEVRFTNDGKAPASAQLVRVDGNRTAKEVVKVTSGNADIPDWIHGAGGVSTTGPGQSGTSTVILKEGRHFVLNDEEGGDAVPPGEFTVTGGEAGQLPVTDATVTGTKVAEDRYAWEISGLKPGKQAVTFVSEGEQAGVPVLHNLFAAPITGDATIEDVKKFFQTDKGKPPIDFEAGQGAPVLDGGNSMVFNMDLKPGRYAFICFIPDRDDPEKPHALKGMLQEEEIK